MAFEFLNKLSNLQQRTIAGLSGAIVMVSMIYFNEWTYFALFFGITYLVLKEFYNLIQQAGIKPNKYYGLISGMSIFTLIFLIEKKLILFNFYFLLFPVLFSVFLIELFKKSDTPFKNIAFAFLGIIYIAIPFALMNVTAFISGAYNFQIVLGMLLLLWANDVGAYFSGRFLGKHLLFPRVSPKKTWEGAIGGALCTCSASLLLNNWFPSTLDKFHWLILSLIIVVAGSYGDLVESMLKRSLALKDSAQTIPGHGGFLDRFDSFLLASPFVAAFLKLLL
ncbi:MAG: phosphatidate cytidylyltransferase [Cytophagales bacterium]|nr:MAG: phosphatidate cytidylyltransferase [Cytophagales bacterium]